MKGNLTAKNLAGTEAITSSSCLAGQPGRQMKTRTAAYADLHVLLPGHYNEEEVQHDENGKSRQSTE